jgi:hypothetical protein
MNRIVGPILLFHNGDASSHSVVEIDMAIGNPKLDSRAQPGEKIDFELGVGFLIGPVKTAVSLEMALPERRKADEEIAEKGDAPVGERRAEKLIFRASDVEDEVVVIGLSPIKTRPVARFKSESHMFVECPLDPVIGVVDCFVFEIVGILRREIERGERIGEVAVESIKKAGEGGIVVEGVGEEIHCKKRPFLKEELLAYSHLQFVDLVEPVLDGENVVSIGRDSGASEG